MTISVNQGAWRPGTNNYEYGFRSIPNIPITNEPSDANGRRWAMLHDGNAYRMYFFKGSTDDTLYQFSWNGSSYPGTTTYRYGAPGWIRDLSVIGFPDDTDWSRWQMLHDGSAYRLYAFRYGSNDQIYQGAWNGSAYEYGHRSIPTLDLVGFPSTSDVGRPAMLHDERNYRFYVQTL